jgi:hypothetical protein
MQDTNDPAFSIVHVSGVGKLYSSIRSQLRYETLVKSHLKPIKWDTVVFHDSEPVESFEYRIPAPFRFIFLRNLYVWWQIWRLASRYDIVMMRYITFDPFGFIFNYFISNIITIHHSKEIEELLLIKNDWRGQAASFFERLMGSLYLRNSLSVVGVTEEIALYETRRVANGMHYAVYPNGIYLDDQSTLQDNRHRSDIRLGFVCSYFSEWHGLDLLLDSIEYCPQNILHTHLQVALIGTLDLSDYKRIANSPILSSVFHVYGYLSATQIEAILASCDAGIGSLALWRKNLHDASTLKVREYLAMGLPVFSGHNDPSFPVNFPYYKNLDLTNLDSTIKTCQALKSTSRTEIRKHSTPYISKVDQMKNLLPRLRNLMNLQ